MLRELLLHVLGEISDDVFEVLFGSLDVISLAGHEIQTLGKLPVFLKSVEVYGSKLPDDILER